MLPQINRRLNAAQNNVDDPQCRMLLMLTSIYKYIRMVINNFGGHDRFTSYKTEPSAGAA